MKQSYCRFQRSDNCKGGGEGGPVFLKNNSNGIRFQNRSHKRPGLGFPENSHRSIIDPIKTYGISRISNQKIY